MSWQTNFKDTAHYVPLTGEIRASKIQGEGRGYPDSVPGDPDYVGNPTGIAKPEEMRFDDKRYRRMCFPDGRIPYIDYFTSGFGNNGGNKGAAIIGGRGYPEIARSTIRAGSLFNAVYYRSYINPFRGISWFYPTSYPPSPPDNRLQTTWFAVQLSHGTLLPSGVSSSITDYAKPHRTQMQYRATRLTDVLNNQTNYRNQIKYARGLNRTDADWRSQDGTTFGDYGFGYSAQELGIGLVYTVSIQGLEQTNQNGDGPFNVPLTDAGEIKFSDFRGKNKFYKTRFHIGKNEANALGTGDYPSSNTTRNQTVLGMTSHPSSSIAIDQGFLEFVGLYGTMQDSTASDDAYNPDGSRAYARGYVNPDFGGKLSASGITLPSSRGAMQHVSTLTTAAFTNYAANSSSRFKPLFASKSFAEPKNSATIGRYDSVTRSMPTYDYVNQGTGSTNRPPIVSNPRDGEMTHCIWYKPNLTGTGAWNGDYKLGYTTSPSGTASTTDGGGTFYFGLPTTWDTSAYTNNSERIGTHVLEFGILGRHYHTSELINAVYWDTGYRYGNMGNTGNSADANRGGGTYYDGCNAVADFHNFRAEIFYASPSADNLYFGQTVWRCEIRVRDPNNNHTSAWDTPGTPVPFDWPAYLFYPDGSAVQHCTRVIFASGDFITYGGTMGSLTYVPSEDGVEV